MNKTSNTIELYIKHIETVASIETNTTQFETIYNTWDNSVSNWNMFGQFVIFFENIERIEIIISIIVTHVINLPMLLNIWMN
jgi:hypothetical protein